MAKPMKNIAANITELTRYDALTDKINVQVVKRMQDIRKLVHRQSWKPDTVNPLIQAKLSKMLP